MAGNLGAPDLTPSGVVKPCTLLRAYLHGAGRLTRSWRRARLREAVCLSDAFSSRLNRRSHGDDLAEERPPHG